jgi:hypothetical protein
MPDNLARHKALEDTPLNISLLISLGYRLLQPPTIAESAANRNIS